MSEKLGLKMKAARSPMCRESQKPREQKAKEFLEG